MTTAADVLALRIKIGYGLLAAMIAGTFSFAMHLAVQRAHVLVDRVPDKGALQIMAGRLVSHEVVRHSSRRRHNGTTTSHIHIAVESQGKVREFTLREEAPVMNALCDGCEMVLWLDEEKIWQFSVRDKIVRAYDVERQLYLDSFKGADPRLVRWSRRAAIFFLALSCFWFWRHGRAARRVPSSAPPQKRR